MATLHTARSVHTATTLPSGQVLKLLNEAGIPPLEVLKIATFNAARALRHENEFGSIRPGLRADLILLSRNPLESIGNTRAIEVVIQNGAIVGR